jgi:hypothetical protein
MLKSRTQANMPRELHASHETTYKTNGPMSSLLRFVKTSFFINIKERAFTDTMTVGIEAV